MSSPRHLDREQLRILRVIHAYGTSGPFRQHVAMPEWAGRWHGNHFHATQAATDFLSEVRSQEEGQT